MYVGPKSLPDLESVNIPGLTGAEPDLRALVDFGWLGVIARPLFLWLKWTYNHIVPNWGWAIVIQTVIINLALLPLRISQMKSMLKMQKIQPQVKSIQEKYKKYSLRDPRKAPMNEEIQALYKKEGVNPVGGCLPMVIQMPFLFAYYRMLGVAIDLRHAPWLWIRDLSAPDPWHLLPIAVILTMLVMQRTTPQAGMDPAQQKMMNVMMPVMLGVISWNLAAGLVPVLVGRQPDRIRAANHHEPHYTRSRNAGDDGKARPKERQIGFSATAFKKRHLTAEAES